MIDLIETRRGLTTLKFLEYKNEELDEKKCFSILYYHQGGSTIKSVDLVTENVDDLMRALNYLIFLVVNKIDPESNFILDCWNKKVNSTETTLDSLVSVFGELDLSISVHELKKYFGQNLHSKDKISYQQYYNVVREMTNVFKFFYFIQFYKQKNFINK